MTSSSKLRIYGVVGRVRPAQSKRRHAYEGLVRYSSRSQVAFTCVRVVYVCGLADTFEMQDESHNAHSPWESIAVGMELVYTCIRNHSRFFSHIGVV